MATIIAGVQRVRSVPPPSNSGLSFSTRRGTFYDLNVGGWLRVLVNDDVCVDDWESNEVGPRISVPDTGALSTAR